MTERLHLAARHRALSNLGVTPRPGFRPEEVWCNAVAAEFLVPLGALKADPRRREALSEAPSRLAGLQGEHAGDSATAAGCGLA